MATTYRKKKEALVAIGSWAESDVTVTLDIDWKALGINPDKALIRAPKVEHMQEERIFALGEAISVPLGEGALLWIKEDK